jgi:hypothetical protein
MDRVRALSLPRPIIIIIIIITDTIILLALFLLALSRGPPQLRIHAMTHALVNQDVMHAQ